MKHLEPIIYNKTLKTFNENVPVHLTLINETTAALNSSTMRTVMSRDTHTEDIFTNLTLAINILTENETYFNEATVQALMKARLRLGMITGDFLSSLPQGVGAGGFLLQGTEVSVRQNLGKVFQVDGEEEKYRRVKNKMLSNIDWNVLYQEYLRFKEDTKEFSKLGSSLSSAINNINVSSRRKREVTSQENATDLEKLFDYVQSEEFLNMSSQYGEMLASVGSEMGNIVSELEVLTSQMGNIDVETLLTLAVTSPRVSAIISSLVKIMDQMEVVFSDSPYLDTFKAVKESFVILDDFVKSTAKNIEISSLLLDWDQVKMFMEEIEAFTASEMSEIGRTVLATQGVFLIMSRLGEWECDPAVVPRYIEFSAVSAPLNSSSEALAASVCGFISSQSWLSLLPALDIPSAFDFLSSVFRLSPQSLAAASNITTSELYDTMANLEAAGTLFPAVEESIENLLTQLNLTELTSTAISSLLCGTNFTELEFNYKVSSLSVSGQPTSQLSFLSATTTTGGQRDGWRRGHVL